MTGTATVVWKEWRELFLPGGRPNRQFFGLLAAAGVIPLFFALLVGGDPLVWQVVVPGMLAFYPMFSIMALVIDSFAGERERHTLETLLATRLPDRAILMGKLVFLMSVAATMGLAAFVFGAVLSPLTLRTVDQYMVALFSFGVTFVGALHFALVAALLGILISMKVATVRAGQTLFAFLVMLPSFIVPVVILPFAATRLPDRERLVEIAPFVIMMAFLVVYGVILVLLSLAMRWFRRETLLAR